ncbi:hypothetical protein B6S12_10800, partial [Helicobacter valdiviensis]
NNKELCEYARRYKSDWSKWQKVPPSINPPFSIGFCAFGANNKYDGFYRCCTEEREVIKEEMAKAIKEKATYISYPKVYKRKIDINNDGVLDNVILSQGEYFSALAIYKNGKLDAKASGKIYGDDLHFHGAKTKEEVCMVNETPCMALTTYALPSNKVSGILLDSEIPILSYLAYGVM